MNKEVTIKRGSINALVLDQVQEIKQFLEKAGFENTPMYIDYLAHEQKIKREIMKVEYKPIPQLLLDTFKHLN